MNKMTKTIVITIMAVCQTLLAADNTLTKKQKAAGWRLLFDGKTLNGWSIKSGFATYKVDNGTIVGTTVKGSPNTFLCTDRKFADFELTFEVKFDDEFFNSGVQIRSKLRGEQYGGRVYGPQIEIEKSPGQAGFIYGEAAGGWQSPEPKSKDKTVNSHSHFRNDAWNKYRVRAVGRKIQTWINGNAVADLMYDEGRYKDNSKGFIGLQVHGVGKRANPMSVRWKNIYIRPIQDSGREKTGQGWVPLFNGKNFDGWRFHLGNEGGDNKGTFTVEDGIILCSGRPTGYIYTEKSFSNYILKYEWAFEQPENLKNDAAFRGNNGCLIHIGEKNTLGIWPLSIEVQGMHRQAGLILPIPRNVKCERTFDKEALAQAINPVGQWSTMEIDVNGGDMLIKINGTVVSTVKNCELTSGPIRLQSEGAPIRWKNIRISER
jgi:hypothetical protein